MALHQSLIDLGQQAPRCNQVATAKGVLAEASDLIRNALLHREDEVALAAWFSRLVCDVIGSPALVSLSHDVTLTGSVVLGDATPTCPISWMGDSPVLEDILTSVGLKSHPASQELAARVDRGLEPDAKIKKQLFAQAMDQRPPVLQQLNGLPNPHQPVDMKEHLLKPIQSVARWASHFPQPTLDRLAIGLESQVLTGQEAQVLSLAWKTGLALDFRTWLEGMDGQVVEFGDLAALDRTAYGAACRMVAETLDSLKSRHVNES